MPRKIWFSGVVLIGSLNSVFPTTAALLLLEPAPYGRFSLIYAVYALGATMVLSAVSEAWTRLGNPRTAWATDAYFASLFVFSILSAFGVAATALLVEGTFGTVVSSSSATFLAVYHSSSRYRRLALGSYGRVLLSDTVMLSASLLMVWLLLGHGANAGIAVFSAWAVGALLTLPVLVSGCRPLLSGLGGWWSNFRVPAGLLVRDSGIAMLNNTAMPFILAPMLGMANFGIYRGVGNLTAVLRLLVSAVRPMIARRSAFFWSSTPVLIFAGSLAIFVGILVSVALTLVPHLGLILGTLSELSNFAVITGAIVAATGLMNLFNAIARVYAEQGALFRARVVTISVAILAPLVGTLIAGLTGAMLGLLVERTFSILFWRQAVKRSRNSGNGGYATPTAA